MTAVASRQLLQQTAECGARLTHKFPVSPA
jgi:hypothetical protein